MSLATLAQSAADSAFKQGARSGYVTTGTLTRTTPGGYDPATGTVTAAVSQIANVNVILDSTSLKTLGFKFGDGLIQAGDIQATVSAKGLPFIPAPGDVLMVPQGTYTVVDVRPEWVGSVAVLYPMLVRR